jgi:hypothetical protein
MNGFLTCSVRSAPSSASGIRSASNTSGSLSTSTSTPSMSRITSVIGASVGDWAVEFISCYLVV